MRGFVDLHCHWIASIDDGARSVDDGVAMLRALHAAGFDRVVATPHMRPGMFSNTRGDLEAAFGAMAPFVGAPDLPEVALSSEHFFDEIVFDRLMHGEGLPYPGGKAVLVEINDRAMPPRLADRFFDLRCKRLRPVLAHPERYQPVWSRIDVLDPLLDGGAVLLLNVAALVGKYGKKAQKAAESLLDAGYYDAACSDAHKPSDVAEVAAGIARLEKLVGREDAEDLLREGPLSILDGTLAD